MRHPASAFVKKTPAQASLDRATSQDLSEGWYDDVVSELKSTADPFGFAQGRLFDCAFARSANYADRRKGWRALRSGWQFI